MQDSFIVFPERAVRLSNIKQFSHINSIGGKQARIFIKGSEESFDTVCTVQSVVDTLKTVYADMAKVAIGGIYIVPSTSQK